MDFEQFKEMMKKMMETMPAKIEATVDENGKARTKMEGRGIELIGLSVEIAVNCIKQFDMPVNVYCEIIQDHFKNEQHKNDIENVIKKILGDL